MSKNKKPDQFGFVFSTNPDFQFTREEDSVEDLPKEKQKLRILLDKKQRKGKAVTVVEGFVGTEATLEALGKALKMKCGVGGTVKNGVILLQGDHRDTVLEYLLKEGYTNTKKSGA